MARVVRAATHVVVFQWSCGTAACRRSPRGHVCSRHVGRCPGLIDEDEAITIELALALAPSLPPHQDIRAILLRGMGGLFLRVMLWRSKKRRIVP